ncbi:hypothetical protein GCM10009560_56730 [Nonomuraea longicatena]|uniref:Transposase n=1 Tax=Nonomuraea longicatena TaxID=83682 RepID=A0ABP4AYQ5_9ACTN
MKLGFLAACLPESRLSDIAHQVVASGIAAPELPGRPATDVRNSTSLDRFTATEKDGRAGIGSTERVQTGLGIAHHPLRPSVRG